MKSHVKTADSALLDLSAESRSAAHEAPELGTEDRTASANYIAEMVAALAELARRCGFGALARTLDISRLEAETLARNRLPRHSGGRPVVR